MSSIRKIPDNLGEASTLLHRTFDLDSLRKDGVPSFGMAAKAILRSLNEQINVCKLSSRPELSDGVTLKSDRLADIRTRFLLWTGNLGVMHEAGDPRSLDTRVNGAPEIASRIRDILKDLQDLLGQYQETYGSETSRQAVVTREMDNIDEGDAMMMQLFGLQTSKVCTTSWLSASIDDALRQLFHLSSLITKSSLRDKFTRSELKCRLDMYEPYDVQYVREKVAYSGGKAEETLIKRLGKANTSRRQFIKYSHEHNAELSVTARE